MTTVIPLGSVDEPQALEAIDEVQALGWTPLSQALAQGAAELGPSGGSLVLVSDGEATCKPDPCDTARSLREENPNLSISTIGFRSTEAQLECIAQKGGGLFVTADNAAQLASRLDAARDTQAAARKLSDTGLAGIDIGDTETAIRDRNPSFPDLATGSEEEEGIVVTWMDCEWVFDDETLVEIRPKNAVTVDGVTEGSPMSRVGELFGEPVRVDEDDSAAYFDTNKLAGVGLRITYTGAVDDGTVRTIVICRCIPQEGEADAGGAIEPSTMEEVCEAWWEVNRAFRRAVVVADSDPTKFEIMVRFGEVASRSPDEAVQWEGSHFLEQTEGGYVRVESYSSMQNIKAWCAGRPPR